jgi:DNA-binding SARP family transcriptional activator
VVPNAPACSGCLRFRFLGDFRIQSPLAACDMHISGKTREVLAFLVLNANKLVRRATLSNVMWGDRDERRSRANLNTALWRINRALKDMGRSDIGLELAATHVKMTVATEVFIDVFALDAAVKEAAQFQGRTGLLPPSVRDALLDILCDDSEGFLDRMSSEWVLVERERFFNLQIRGLTLLMQDLAGSGRIEEALEYGRRILRMDPMRECVQRQVMWLHVLNGHQGNAVRQYQECARLLKDEIGVAPMPETRALYDFILAQGAKPKDAPSPLRTGCTFFEPVAGRASGSYDEDLTKLRALLSQLNSHRRSVLSALSEASAN